MNNQYRPQAQRRDGLFTFLIVLLVVAGIFIPAFYYMHTDVSPSLQRLIEQLQTH